MIIPHRIAAEAADAVRSAARMVNSRRFTRVRGLRDVTSDRDPLTPARLPHEHRARQELREAEETATGPFRYYGHYVLRTSTDTDTTRSALNVLSL